jgi:PPM family protein phosphatase
MVRVRISGVTQCGTGRSRNEDSIGCSGGGGVRADGSMESLIVTGAPCLAVVADGLGGHPAGDVASRITVDAILSAAPTDADALVASVRDAHGRLLDAMASDVQLRGMGSTVVVALILADEFVVVNVGDSEAFALTERGVGPLAVPDVTRDDFGPHGFRSSTLTQFVGGEAAGAELDIHVHRAARGEVLRLLLCSDGLTGAVPRAEIEDLTSHRSGLPAVRSLLDEAVASRHGDDISIVLIEVDRGVE